MCGTSYRPRPDNGSGDSPRPPFLTEFVNHIGKLALAEVVYHLIGGHSRLRIHPHVQGSIRLKAESSRRIPELQIAHAEVGQQAVGDRRSIRNSRKGTVSQLHARPVIALWH